MLPEMLKAIELLKEELKINIFLLKAQNIDKQIILELLKKHESRVKIINQSQGHDLINASDIVITTCGTANLEIALIGVPFVVCYRLHKLSYYLGIHLVKIELYSIVNILAKEKIVPELIQKDFQAEKVFKEVRQILQNKELRDHMLNKFKEIKKQLRQDVNPSEIIYKKIYNDLIR